jgi:predicted alpha/beta hydrolase
MQYSERQSAAFSPELIETLAAAEHDRWSHWQRYLHAQCTEEPDGSLRIPAHLVRQWSRQMTTPYGDLTEAERNSDREQVHRYLPIIAAALDKSPP